MRLNVNYPVDLHLHSAFSDGLLSPEALCTAADRLRLTHIALCDHDTVAGLSEMQHAVERASCARMARGGPPLALLPSVELSSGQGGRVHVLGYGLRPEDPALLRFLAEAGAEREARAQQIVSRLRAEGVAIPEAEEAALTGPTVGRAHIARMLVRLGVVATVSQAFDRYLAEGKSAYVPRSRLETAQAIGLLRAAGAVPVLAHPYRLPLDEPALWMTLQAYQAQGLMGVEAYHPSASRAQAQRLDSFARKSGLLVTGGSDFHGDPGARVRMARMPGGWATAAQDAERLLRAGRCHRLPTTS